MKPLDLSQDALWKQRFRAHSILYARTAETNPTRGIAATNQTGVIQLYAWDVPTGKLTQLTNVETGKAFGAISSRGDYVYYLNDQQGNELGHFARVPFEGGEPVDITPDLPLYSSFGISESHSGEFIGLMAANAEGFQYYVIQQQQDGMLSAPRLLWKSPALSGGLQFSRDADLAVIPTTERTRKIAYDLVVVDTQTGEKIATLAEGESSLNPVTFSPLPGDSRILALTDQSGYNRPLLWNPRTGARADIALPTVEGDIQGWDWSPDGKRILLCQLHQAEYQLYTYELETQTLTRLNHPRGAWYGGYFTPDGDIWAMYQNSSTPARLIALDGKTGEQKQVILVADDAFAGRAMQSVIIPSNGVDVQIWVGVPEGEGPFPTILHTHGGPTAVQTDVYSPAFQTWLDHGFAVISVNYRGSVTFGKDFERAIWGKLGSVEVDDMAAARDWAVQQGIADPGSILLTGWSYGGYLTLQGLGKRPDLWAGGMAGIAIADWSLMYEDQAETLRGYQRALFGGTPEEKPEAHRQSSPITYADALRAPVLVIQGSNDTRCPARQMRVYEDTLRQKGKDIQIHWFDAGHGSMSIEQNIEHQELMLRFAYRVLG